MSFGNIAASGGYYIATAARKVLAAPSILTESIGVIGGKLHLGGLFAKVGITVDAVEKGKRAGYTSPSRPFSEEEAQVVRKQMRQFYEELFLEKGSRGAAEKSEERPAGSGGAGVDRSRSPGAATPRPNRRPSGRLPGGPGRGRTAGNQASPNRHVHQEVEVAGPVFPSLCQSS